MAARARLQKLEFEDALAAPSEVIEVGQRSAHCAAAAAMDERGWFREVYGLDLEPAAGIADHPEP
jgi:hypothetical protein